MKMIVFILLALFVTGCHTQRVFKSSQGATAKSTPVWRGQRLLYKIEVTPDGLISKRISSDEESLAEEVAETLCPKGYTQLVSRGGRLIGNVYTSCHGSSIGFGEVNVRNQTLYTNGVGFNNSDCTSNKESDVQYYEIVVECDK